MTVSSSTNKTGPYTGNGSTTVFAYTFKIDDEDELRVVETVGGVDTDLTAGFTVSGVGDAGGGDVTFSTAPASTAKITLIRDVPFTQASDYSNQGSVEPETIEGDLDRAVMRDQQLAEQLGRVLQLPLSSTASGQLPELVAGRSLVVNSDASGFDLDAQPSVADTAVFATRAAAAAALDASTDFAIVAGTAAALDGGTGLYVRVGSEPGHDNKFQGTDGTWFELAPLDATVLEGITAAGFAILQAADAAAQRTALVAAGTGDANTFTADQRIVSTDAGAAAGPLLQLYRNSASAAASDVLAALEFRGNTNAAEEIIYARIAALINDPTSGAEFAQLLLQTMQNNEWTTRFRIGAGFFATAQTDKGAGSINGDLYQNGVSLNNGIIRAHVNFTGSGTVAIKAAANVSSITDNGSGDYWVNFTVAEADTNYTILGTAGNSATNVLRAVSTHTKETGRVRIVTRDGTNLLDADDVNVLVVR